MINKESVTLIIFVVTYLGIIFSTLPGLNVDRPSAAFFGAVAMVLFGIINFDEAIRAIDYNTIALLLGMMILISVLELDGFFTLIAQKTITFSHNKNQLLFIIIFTTGIASAFLVNDAVVLLFTPVVIKICESGKLNPVPFLIAEIMASNSGSALTITGNPQNILIGISSGIAFGRFMLYMLPISVFGLLIIYFVIKFFFKNEFKEGKDLLFTEDNLTYDYKSMNTSVPIFILVVLAFFFSKEINYSYSIIALAGASLVLIFGRIKPAKVIGQVDWVLLLFFASLFIIVHCVEKVGVLNPLVDLFHLSGKSGGIVPLHFSSLVLSQIVSNVPYTILMIPVLSPLKNDVLWLTLASSATLAGNLTIIGAMANLIVIEIAKSNKIEIKFFDFLKIGIVVTVFSFLVSIAVLWLGSYYNFIV
jgi:Na+/H+ antiporter NhaD/arsenite permease-like protein